MEIDDIVLVNCYRGYRPGWVKEIGKRKVLIIWPDRRTREWIDKDRIREPKNFKDRNWMEKALRAEKEMIKSK
jgi:hypothetical protein